MLQQYLVKVALEKKNLFKTEYGLNFLYPFSAVEEKTLIFTHLVLLCRLAGGFTYKLEGNIKRTTSFVSKQ